LRHVRRSGESKGLGAFCHSDLEGAVRRMDPTPWAERKNC
jgi:hypothetical protein